MPEPTDGPPPPEVTAELAAGDSPIRAYSNIAHIAEIVCRFDVIAI